MSLKKKIKKVYEDFLLQKGCRLWLKFDLVAPQAVGVLEDDQNRLALFRDYVTHLSFFKQLCLKKWLERQLYIFEFYGPEGPSCATEEAYCMKWSQIYRTHLECFE